MHVMASMEKFLIVVEFQWQYVLSPQKTHTLTDPLSPQLSGIKTYVIIMLRDNEGVELYDTQFRPTETIQEARIVAVWATIGVLNFLDGSTMLISHPSQVLSNLMCKVYLLDSEYYVFPLSVIFDFEQLL